MSIKSIKIKNLLSFDELIISELEDINCIVGKNNTGKSNLLKLIRFFYNKLDGQRELPPTLNSNYSTFGTITITYDTSRIKNIVTSDTNKNKSKFFKHIYNTLFKEHQQNLIFQTLDDFQKDSTFELTLQINSDDSTKWSIKDKNVLNIINYLYPFFDIETRHIDLYDWDKLWLIVSRLKSFNIDKINEDEIIEFFNEKISLDSSNYKEYIRKIQDITKTGRYNYREKVLNYVKAGLKGHTFLIDNKSLDTQSDGTNSHRFIEIALELLISLSRRDYINPTIFIDEPEVGLHPKRNEELIYRLFNVYHSYKKTNKEREKGKYKTPYPKIIFSTHSPNIVKEVIKLFDTNQQILHFAKDNRDNTVVKKMNSQYENKKFLNVFSDNESRLFFSNLILFVEGATEEEIFANRALIEKFNKLQDIDIYATDELVLKYMNPSYANYSIPYLVLYDADKLIGVDIEKRKLYFKKETVSLTSYLQMYKKSYVGSKQRLIYSFLKQLIEWEKAIELEFTDNIYIKNINYSLLIQYINDNFLKKENYHLNRTTIEEVLINKDSFCFFKRWLFHEFRKSIEKSYNDKMPDCAKKRIKKKKIDEIKKFKRYVDSNLTTEEEQVTAFILVFGGKTETSITTFTQNSDKLNEDFKRKIKKIKENYFYSKKSLNLGYLLGKTSGWATSYLNFSIEEIEKNKGENEFRDEFKKYFREFYEIIVTIENKL